MDSNIDTFKYHKTAGFEKLTIWNKFNRLAAITGSVNLGQGFPDWQSPKFFVEAMERNLEDPKSNYQYTRSYGSIKLVESIARNYKKAFKRDIDPMNEVLVSNGAVALLYNAITAFIHEGDELIVIEPFYECYLPQARFSGGKVVGIPMKQPQARSKSEYEKISNIKDDWQFDFELLEKSLNEKTKMIILNTPNNPTGKILTYDELGRIAAILEKFPNVIVVMDEVYEHMIFDEYEELPRMATLNGMWEKTISIMSAGKIFSATGLRMAWMIGAKNLLVKVNAIHQFNGFCLFEPIQNAIAEALDIANQPYEGHSNYYRWLKHIYQENRDYFVQNLAKIENFDLKFYLPEGSYFVIADISEKENLPEHKFEGEENEDNLYPKDFNFCMNMAYDRKLIAVPLSPFYTDEHKHIGANFIRFAFCKKRETLDKALDKLRNAN